MNSEYINPERLWRSRPAMDENIRSTLLSMLSEDRISRIDEVLDRRTSHITILLDRIFHPHNIAAVIRSADAFGLSTIHLIESEKKFTPSIANSNNGNDHEHSTSDALKSPGISMGSEKWVQVKRHSETQNAIQELRESGFTLVCLCPPPLYGTTKETLENKSPSEKRNEPICISELPFEEKLCLVFGSELEGLSKELTSEADILAFIPMYGFVESFNISVACAITLFCSTIPKTKAERRTAQLTPYEKEILRDEWIKKSVPRVDRILPQLEKRAKD